MRGDWILSTQRLPIPIGRWGTRAETTLLLFHPRWKENFVVVFVSFFLELESIGTRKCKIVKMRGILSQVQAEFGRRRRVVFSWARIDRNASI